MEPGSDRDLGGFGAKWSGGVWALGSGGDTKVVRVRAAEGENRKTSEIRVCFTPAMISTTNRPLVLQDLPCRT
jgi:hypothetical protein